ncbi:MAG: hypothetical protein ACFHWX_16940 [Bacteroidota bacterium]
MVYDCFNFFNELDLLEIRLNVLNEVVDRFVIVEANRTHQGKSKPMNLEANWSRFKDFEHKITYLKLEKGYPNFFTRWRPVKTWDIERIQREKFFDGLQEAADTDRVIISDLDEIPNPDLIRVNLTAEKPKVFIQKIYKYFLNSVCYNETWRGPVLLPYGTLKNMTIKLARLLRDDKILKREGIEVDFLDNGGWHFTTVGDIEKIIEKMENFAHKEFNTKKMKDEDRIMKIIEEGGDIFGFTWKFKLEKMNDTYPKYLVQNQMKYNHLIKTV